MLHNPVELTGNIFVHHPMVTAKEDREYLEEISELGFGRSPELV